ncbi:MAG: hypothetical protein WC247_14730 [Porticoccaceae bacterium]
MVDPDVMGGPKGQGDYAATAKRDKAGALSATDKPVSPGVVIGQRNQNV